MCAFRTTRRRRHADREAQRRRPRGDHLPRPVQAALALQASLQAVAAPRQDAAVVAGRLLLHQQQPGALPADLHFFNVSGGQGRPFIHPSFAFLPTRGRPDLLDCCNGLVLCRWYIVSSAPDPDDDDDDGFSYVVCNPATEEWVTLPDNPNYDKAIMVERVRVGFDQAASSGFHVFVFFWHGRRRVRGVGVYSSKPGHYEMRLGGDVNLFHNRKQTVFLNGRLHFYTLDYHAYDDSGHRVLRGVSSIAAVDTDGETWTNFGFHSHLQRDMGQEDSCIMQILLREIPALR
ncbi:hypothetical protein ZWY2020_001072 [Hordeum vulgare]|nr:hypothetical protein ZWY2020_001072 [Hordeum vulgare]